MDDDLAEMLFNAFWARAVAYGVRAPTPWRSLTDWQRACWDVAATKAREVMVGRFMTTVAEAASREDAPAFLRERWGR